MKFRLFAMVLALSLVAWAQENPTTPAPNATPKTEAKSCCHHADSDAKDAAGCCGNSKDKCEMKDAKACCGGKDMKACMKGDKKSGSCAEGKCCGAAGEKSAANCCGNKCEHSASGN